MPLDFPATFYSATHYGFPEDEAARIRDRFPNVRLVFDTEALSMSVWAIGESRSIWPLIADIKAPDFYKVHDRLLAMHYKAQNRAARAAVDELVQDSKRAHTDHVDGAVSAMEPDRMAHRFRRELGNPVVQASVLG